MFIFRGRYIFTIEYFRMLSAHVMRLVGQAISYNISYPNEQCSSAQRQIKMNKKKEANVKTPVIYGYPWGYLLLLHQPNCLPDNLRESLFQWNAAQLLTLPCRYMDTQIAMFMGPTWVPPGSCRPQTGPMLAPWILLSRYSFLIWIAAIKQ